MGRANESSRLPHASFKVTAYLLVGFLAVPHGSWPCSKKLGVQKPMLAQDNPARAKTCKIRIVRGREGERERGREGGRDLYVCM